MKLVADFVLVSGFALTAVILFLLAISPGRRAPQNILIVFLSINLLIIVTISAFIHQLKWLFFWTHLFEDGARFVLGPLLFLYIQSIFREGKNVIKDNLSHFIPFLLYFFTFTVPLKILTHVEEPLFDYLRFFYGTAYLALIKDAFLLFYIVLSARLFFRFKATMELNYSNISETNFLWLNKLLIAFLLVVLFDIFIIAYSLVFQPEFVGDMALLSIGFLILTTIYLGYYGLRQSMVDLPDFLVQAQPNYKKTKNGSSNPILTQEEQKRLKVKLEKVLLVEKPFLQPELTLNQLAQYIDTTDKKLSVLLNQFMDISFYDLINAYRVAEMKKKLMAQEDHKYSLLGLAYTCGFNSKSSFYRAFKKETGVSPAEYKKKMHSAGAMNVSDVTQEF